MSAKDTAGARAAASLLATLWERKVKPSGERQEYGLVPLALYRHLAVGRLLLPRGVQPGRLPISLPPGSTSDGYFWSRRPYSLYRFRGPGGEVKGHRFDAVTAVSLAGGAVSYRDLALDWWVLVDGTVIEEDREELDLLVASGAMSYGDRVRAEAAGRRIREGHRRILAEVARLEAEIEGR